MPGSRVPYLLPVANSWSRCELELALALTHLHLRRSSSSPRRAGIDASCIAMPHNYFTLVSLWGSCCPFVCSSRCWLATLVVVAGLLAASLLVILNSVCCRGLCWTLLLLYRVRKQKCFCCRSLVLTVVCKQGERERDEQHQKGKFYYLLLSLHTCPWSILYTWPKYSFHKKGK